MHRKLHADHAREPVMPFYLIESIYEGEHNASDVQIRRQAYWAMLCGGCGHFLGNWPVWGFYPGWQAALDSRGAHDMLRVKRLFESRPWHLLVPDLDHVVVVTGLGEFRGLDYCAAARASDGSCMIAYMPTARTVTVDTEQVNGPMQQAWWFNPRTGQATYAGQSNRFRRCFQEFATPDEGDWVLVLDDATTHTPQLPGQPMS